MLLVPDAKTHCLIQGYKDLLAWGVFWVDFESQEGFCWEGRRGRPGLARQSGAGSPQGGDMPEPPVGTGCVLGPWLPSPGHWLGRLARLPHRPRMKREVF